MLRWTIIFLVLALIAGVLGFGNIAGVSTDIARILFLIFVVLFIVAALVNALRGRTPPV